MGKQMNLVREILDEGYVQATRITIITVIFTDAALLVTASDSPQQRRHGTRHDRQAVGQEHGGVIHGCAQADAHGPQCARRQVAQQCGSVRRCRGGLVEVE